MTVTQYHGGTNFGRSASSFVTTSYYDHAPLDEYGIFLLERRKKIYVILNTLLSYLIVFIFAFFIQVLYGNLHGLISENCMLQ